MFRCQIVSGCPDCGKPLLRVDGVGIGAWLMVLFLTRIAGWDLGFSFDDGPKVEIFVTVSGRATHWAGMHEHCASLKVAN